MLGSEATGFEGVSRPPLLPAGAAPPRLIVCERHGDWAAALRRELADSPLPIVETRSLPDAWQRLAESPSSIVVAELTRANAASLVERLARLERDYPLARAAVVARRELAHHEFLVREAGAVHFVASLRRLRPMAELVCRHLAQAPVAPRDFFERIWAALPWKPPPGDPVAPPAGPATREA